MHIVRAVFRVAVCSLLAAPATAQARPFADADIAAIKALNQKWAAAQVTGAFI